MNGSLGEIRVALTGVAEQIGSAGQHAGMARARIADAVAVLDGLGAQHSEPLVPVELRRAVEELERVVGLISRSAAVVAELDARL